MTSFATEKNGVSNLVIGMGQIGSAIKQILDCDAFDLYKDYRNSQRSYYAIHICFPYSDKFEEYVRTYQQTFSPDLTIIHSTVPVGTSAKLGAIHSPVRGIHPDLEKGIRTFVKFFGGPRADEAAKLFSDLGIYTQITSDARNTEAMKLWDTTIYGWNIILEKEIYKYCKDNGLDFNLVYTLANESYNDGYEELGQNQYKKYILQHRDEKIGGHCVIPNLDLLKGLIPNIINEYNSKL